MKLRWPRILQTISDVRRSWRCSHHRLTANYKTEFENTKITLNCYIKFFCLFQTNGKIENVGIVAHCRNIPVYYQRSYCSFVMKIDILHCRNFYHDMIGQFKKYILRTRQITVLTIYYGKEQVTQSNHRYIYFTKRIIA